MAETSLHAFRPLFMPVGQWHELSEARKWFKLIFSRLEKPFYLVLWDKTRTCSNKKYLRLLKLGKGVQGSLTRFCLEEFCWLGFIVPMWEREKKISNLFTHEFLSSVLLQMVPHHHHPTSSLWVGSQLLPETFFPIISVQSTQSILSYKQQKIPRRLRNVCPQLYFY